MNQLVHCLAFVVAGASASDIPDCAIGDLQCLESMPVLGCSEEDAESVQRCSHSMALLAQKSNAGWRDATRMLALAYRVRSDRPNAGAATSRDDRQWSIKLYRGLIESTATDAESVFGLAGAVEDGAERIRLLRQYIVMSPDTVFGRRSLANDLYDQGKGSPEAIREAGRLMEEAYALQPDAHRWWLARNAIRYYEVGGKPELATALKARVIQDLAVVDLTDETLTADPVKAGRVLSIVCDSYLIEAAGSGKCLLNLDRVESFLVTAARNDNSRHVADIAAEAMVGIARADSALCEDLATRLDRFAASGLDSPAIQRSRELVRQLEGTITVE